MRTIVDGTVITLSRLAEVHRENRQTLMNELGEPTINRDAVELVRQTEMLLLENVSLRHAETLVQVAETLGPTQRAELVERAR